MSTLCIKAAKSKSTFKKKQRKITHETEDQHNSKLPTNRNVGIQTVASSEYSNKKRKSDSAMSKSLENIMYLKNLTQENISMSKTDISIVYGMYKNLLQKCKKNEEVHFENYRVLLNEIHKFQSQLNDQEANHKSIIKLVTSMMSQHRLDAIMRRKKSNRVNKMLILKFSQISLINYKLQSFMENLEAKNLAVELKIDEFISVTNLEKPKKENKKLKKSTCCCCM